MPLQSGAKLGHYEILAPIGAGGMGEVYRARDPRLNRDVAIKVSDAEFSKRFEREAKSIAALNHPNICQVYDVGPNYLVLAELEGTALDVLTDPHLLAAFRYLAAPPISEDDLTVLAEAPSLAKGRLQSRPEDVRRLIEVVRLVLDRRRFSWVVENREPTEAERGAAVMACPLHIRAGQVVEQHIELGSEQLAVSLLEVLLQLRLVRQTPIQATIQARVVDLAFLDPQQIVQRRRWIPALFNCQFAAWRAQPVDR